MKKVWLFLVLALLAVNSYAKEPMFVSDSVEIIPIHHGGGIKPGGGRGHFVRFFLCFARIISSPVAWYIRLLYGRIHPSGWNGILW